METLRSGIPDLPLPSVPTRSIPDGGGSMAIDSSYRGTDASLDP